MQNKKIQSKTGLTLIETLVAISVLLMSVIGPMVIYSRSISEARFAGNQITAYYLAQEAMEFVKYKVNTNFNDGTLWLVPELSNCIGVNTCTVDSVNDNVNACGGSCPVLRVDNDLYNYISGVNTIFTRGVNIIDNGNEATVVVEVSWTDAVGGKTITIKENIFEWR